MKKFFILLIIGVMFLGIGKTMAQENNQSIIRVGVYDNFPKIYRDQNFEIKGFWADLISYIAKQEKWNIEFVYDTWDNNLKKLENGDIDLMVDVAFSEERQEKYDFNQETVLISWGVMYTRQGLTLESFSDLQDKKIAILDASIHYSAPLGLENMLASFGLTAEIIRVNQYDQVFQLLNDEQADVGVVSWYFGLANEDLYKVDRTNIMFNPSELKFAQSKSTKFPILEGLDKHLKQLKNNRSSIYYGLIQSYFGKDLEKIEIIPLWLKYLLITLGIILILFSIVIILIRGYNQILKKQVAERVKQIRNGEEKYKAVVDEAQDGVLILKDLKVKFANKAMLNLCGRTKKSLMNQPFIDFIVSDQRKKFLEIMSKITRKEKLSAQELTMQCKANGLIDISLAGNIVNYSTGPVVVCVIRNISEQKKMERQQKELDALKTKFIEVVSHQLRTPLNAIRWSLESLLDKPEKLSQVNSKGTLQNALVANVEVINRIGDLLTALDIEQGRLVNLRTGEVSLEKIWQEVKVNQQDLIENKKIKLDDIKSPVKLPMLLSVDEDKIRLCFEKLLHNALIYTPEKGQIITELKLENNKIVFKIKDTGIGIPPDEQKYIGTRFFRASNASLMMPDASGLGLFIAKYFIKLHGGQLDFVSQLGQGSEFWFDLPVNKAKKD